MWNGSIALPKRITEGQDKEGFSEGESWEWEGGIPASYIDVTRSDETLAAQMGYSADRNIEIMACNYQGERYLLDEGEGQMYDIKRTFQKERSMTIILTCERREHGI
ncbi:hypothetical protein [Blautia argi]|uniref:hypothetical protein n=1 Tax=Blautia argi TaxID=1912897 RepID=UPI002942266D|nr:hypothetical protein [Blautia argi]